MNFSKACQWIEDNKEWLFSGAGLILLSVIFRNFKKIIKGIKLIKTWLFRKKTILLSFTSPIKGNMVNIIDSSIKTAVLKEKKVNKKRIYNLSLKSKYQIYSYDYWNDLDNQLYEKVKVIESSILEEYPNINISVFSLAPMPLIIKLGALLGDKIDIDVYQKYREPDTWVWLEDNKTNDFTFRVREISEGKDIVLILSLTDNISEDRALDVISPSVVYTINARTYGVNSIKSKKDLESFWFVYQQVCNEILNKYGNDCIIHVFPSMPVSAAFEVGRRRMPNAYPKMMIYDEYNGFKATLTVGE